MLTKQQLQERRNSIGGSDAAVTCGASPWKTPLALWQEKTGKVTPPDIGNEDAVWWGSQLETLISERASDKYGLDIRQSHTMVKHPEHDFMHAMIDGKIVGKHQGVEIKTTSGYNLDQWGEEGSSDIPLHYLLQCVHYQIVKGWTDHPWIVLLLVDGRELRQYEVPFDKELAEMLMQKEHDFWNKVVNVVEPEPRTEADMVSIWSHDNGNAIIAPPEAIEIHSDLLQVKSQLKQIGEQKNHLELALKRLMEDNAEMLVTPDGEVLSTWKSAKDTSFFDKVAFAENHPELLKEYTKQREGSRRFLLKGKAA
jgi:putative phage-type endonuclease